MRICGRGGRRERERSAAREMAEVMRDLERLDSSVPGVGERDG